MTPYRPYLIRCMYEWILDNGMTPHIVVDTSMENVDVPDYLVEDNRIVLNINPSAIRDMQLGNERVLFKTRFNGDSFLINLPTNSIIAIFARENGRGINFQNEISMDESFVSNGLKSVKPDLKIVK